MFVWKPRSFQSKIGPRPRRIGLVSKCTRRPTIAHTARLYLPPIFLRTLSWSRLHKVCGTAQAQDLTLELVDNTLAQRDSAIARTTYLIEWSDPMNVTDRNSGKQRTA